MQQREDAARLAANLLQEHPLFKAARHIACYYACGDEFQTHPLIETIWQAEKICYLPVLSDAKTLQFRQYDKNDELQDNQYSIPEPVSTRHAVHAEKLDLVLMPLVAYDGKGGRIGTGGGYYDRTFAFMFTHQEKIPTLLGVGYAAQYCNDIQPEPWDIGLNGVLTEQELTLF